MSSPSSSSPAPAADADNGASCGHYHAVPPTAELSKSVFAEPDVEKIAERHKRRKEIMENRREKIEHEEGRREPNQERIGFCRSRKTRPVFPPSDDDECEEHILEHERESKEAAKRENSRRAYCHLQNSHPATGDSFRWSMFLSVVWACTSTAATIAAHVHPVGIVWGYMLAVNQLMSCCTAFVVVRAGRSSLRKYWDNVVMNCVKRTSYALARRAGDIAMKRFEYPRAFKRTTIFLAVGVVGIVARRLYMRFKKSRTVEIESTKTREAFFTEAVNHARKHESMGMLTIVDSAIAIITIIYGTIVGFDSGMAVYSLVSKHISRARSALLGVLVFFNVSTDDDTVIDGADRFITAATKRAKSAPTLAEAVDALDRDSDSDSELADEIKSQASDVKADLDGSLLPGHANAPRKKRDHYIMGIACIALMVFAGLGVWWYRTTRKVLESYKSTPVWIYYDPNRKKWRMMKQADQPNQYNIDDLPEEAVEFGDTVILLGSYSRASLPKWVNDQITYVAGYAMDLRMVAESGSVTEGLKKEAPSSPTPVPAVAPTPDHQEEEASVATTPVTESKAVSSSKDEMTVSVDSVAASPVPQPSHDAVAASTAQPPATTTSVQPTTVNTVDPAVLAAEVVRVLEAQGYNSGHGKGHHGRGGNKKQRKLYMTQSRKGEWIAYDENGKRAGQTHADDELIFQDRFAVEDYSLDIGEDVRDSAEYGEEFDDWVAKTQRNYGDLSSEQVAMEEMRRRRMQREAGQWCKKKDCNKKCGLKHFLKTCTKPRCDGKDCDMFHKTPAVKASKAPQKEKPQEKDTTPKVRESLGDSVPVQKMGHAKKNAFVTVTFKDGSHMVSSAFGMYNRLWTTAHTFQTPAATSSTTKPLDNVASVAVSFEGKTYSVQINNIKFHATEDICCLPLMPGMQCYTLSDLSIAAGACLLAWSDGTPEWQSSFGRFTLRSNQLVHTAPTQVGNCGAVVVDRYGKAMGMHYLGGGEKGKEPNNEAIVLTPTLLRTTMGTNFSSAPANQ